MVGTVPQGRLDGFEETRVRTRRRTKAWLSLIVLPLAVTLSACGDVFGPDGRFSEEAIEFYTEVALGAEFGDASPVVRKWTEDLTVRVEGNPSRAALTELERVVDELNQLRSGPRIKFVSPAESSNVAVHFAPESTFDEILPQYVPVNRGFFWFWFNNRAEITSAVILVDNTDAISQTFRNHMIREEFTQTLGLANDSRRFPGSIFHATHPPVPTEYSQLDEEVIRIHDLSEIQPGMTEEDVRRVLDS